MSTVVNKLFVYGSLRSGFKSPAYAYLAHYFSYAGEGLVKGKFYSKENNPVAIPSEKEEMIVGELYVLKNEIEFEYAFEQLDDYEGLKVESGEIPMYKREVVNVFQHDQVIPAYIYWYNGSVNNLHPIPSGDLIDYMQQKK